jgi:hypothetical protein
MVSECKVCAGTKATVSDWENAGDGCRRNGHHGIMILTC